ncbi:Pc22g00120 [Penicillium rubens Wisconsin 54-1255]|uniref:Pc22g00120 protein n=1 Tax=Penicillium rubens (strain ATCC 28089 / DSM 1075 / NRRL 1951 / Wisconsin 54-1255) TaxID=500485 RepID=B6HP79_PENRW|nr:Pc22g00120 [Penicillium rubens Wisconsin 54-1255]
MSPPPLVAREDTRRRPYGPRSRNGCLTCKRRKRLNLECDWKVNEPQRHPSLQNDPVSLKSNVALEVNQLSPSPFLFDFHPMPAPTEGFHMFQNVYFPDFGDFTALGNTYQQARSSDADSPSSSLPPRQSSQHSPVANPEVQTSLHLHLPPILDPVENGPRCASARELLENMATSSQMLRSSIAAFEAIQSGSGGGPAGYQQHYENAATELSQRFGESAGDVIISDNELRYVLATIFFLTYINFLTSRLDLAYLNLAKAHNALQASQRSGLGSTELRIISWIRLLDARAASAGGEGVLVNDTSGIYTSPQGSSYPSSTPQSIGSASNPGAHEVIYDLLCQPGITFFQEVQTITGRITRIAHNHRSRGSVEDETEVMAIAADILADLSSFDTLAEPLASTIVRSFQTYLANFYACYIHLHRVAHRHLVRSKAAVTALCKIKEIVHRMVNNNESIPVNMLWPLFLWGTEEDDSDEFQWILQTIRGLQHVFTNANMTADVLQETQRRQREGGKRVDIRSVCLELFYTTFAIV